jgi:nitrile hydratase accessory protein
VKPPPTAAAEAMTGEQALPRDNGAFVFDQPWEGHAFGLAVAIVDRLGLPWREFQQRLIAAIAADPTGPYYERWAVALESLAVDLQLVSTVELDVAAHRATGPGHEHDHDHDHD